MTLLSYTFYYVVAAVLIFQGTHAFQEPSAPLGVVPEEVAQEAGKARLRGAILGGYGYLSLALGLLSHAYAAFQGILTSVMAVGLGLVAAYGLYVIFFNRLVKYQGAASAPAHHDHR